jgi:hypothetical protein
MLLAAAGDQICRMAIWERIEGWQVFLTATVIITAWAVVQIARLYFVADAAKHCPHHHDHHDD